MLNCWSSDQVQDWPPVVRNAFGDEDLSIFPLPLGLEGEIGILVAGSRRAGFPARTERLLLTVAANQAAVGLQEAQLISEQKRVAEELDRKVNLLSLATAGRYRLKRGQAKCFSSRRTAIGQSPMTAGVTGAQADFLGQRYEHLRG